MSPFTDEERQIFDCYSKIRECRQNLASGGGSSVETVVKDVLSSHPTEWLLALELLELSKLSALPSTLEAKVLELLTGQQKNATAEVADLIAKGIKIADVVD